MEYLASLNWIAIAIAVVVSFFFGNVYFHPGVFGSVWAAAAGVEPKLSALAVIGTLVATTFGCIGLALVLRVAGLSGLGAGIAVALTLSVAFVLPAIVGQWLFMGKIKLFAVNMGFNLVNLLLIGAILGIMQKVQA